MRLRFLLPIPKKLLDALTTLNVLQEAHAVMALAEVTAHARTENALPMSSAAIHLECACLTLYLTVAMSSEFQETDLFIRETCSLPTLNS